MCLKHVPETCAKNMCLKHVEEEIQFDFTIEGGELFYLHGKRLLN